jgi:integrase/recombinase XerD
VRQWLSIIRSFFLWLNRTGYLLHNPAERLAFPHKEQSLPHVLNESDIARLIETPDTTTTIGLRDRALMEVLYATGIRHSEAHKLDLYDVDTAALCLNVRLGKGQRDRLVPLTETSAHWLTRYVTAARPELAAGKLWGKVKRRSPPKIIPPTSALWLSVTGRRLSYQMIADRIRDYALRAEVKASVHFVTAARLIFCAVGPAFVTSNNSGPS